MQCTPPLRIVLYLALSSILSLNASQAVEKTIDVQEIAPKKAPALKDTTPPIKKLFSDVSDRIMLSDQAKNLGYDFQELKQPLTHLAELCQPHSELYLALVTVVKTLLTTPPNNDPQGTNEAALATFINQFFKTFPHLESDVLGQTEVRKSLRTICTYYREVHKQSSELGKGSSLLTGLAIGASVVALAALCYICWSYGKNSNDTKRVSTAATSPIQTSTATSDGSGPASSPQQTQTPKDSLLRTPPRVRRTPIYQSYPSGGSPKGAQTPEQKTLGQPQKEKQSPTGSVSSFDVEDGGTF